MKLWTLVLSAFLIWLLAAFFLFSYFDTLEQASNFGESFGAVSALFSSLALALAIYSMILQQKQNEHFEKQTRGSLEQQTQQIQMLQKNIEEQLAIAKVTAMTTLISLEEQKIENLKQWGEQQGDIMKYERGIQAASKRIENYHQELINYAQS